MKIAKNPLILLLFFVLLSGCSTLKFGNERNQYSSEEPKDNDIKEFDLSYYYKVMGVGVTGTKSITENIFTHPDGKTLFLFISFPRIGILKTSDNGKTFVSQFFRLKFLDNIYEYSKNNDDENANANTKSANQERQLRYFSHFAVSSRSPNKIIITHGPYIFYSNDYGQKWTVKNIFIDYEKSNIKDIFVNGNDDVVIFTENKIAISKNWCEKWDVKSLKIPNINFFKMNYITGYYDLSTDFIYASIQNLDENDSLLSRNSYDFIYQNKQLSSRSGLYYTEDFGKSWKNTSVNIPVALWKYNDKLYASSIYPLAYYHKKFDENFVNSPLYTNGKLDRSTYNLSDYLNLLISDAFESFEILSPNENRIIRVDSVSNYQIIDENNFDNIYSGIKRLENIDYVQWQDQWYTQQKSGNFSYEYNPYRMFKLWSGMRTNLPFFYSKFNNTYFRVRPSKEFLNVFFKYAVDNQIRLNSIHPFLRKSTDIEFFDPTLDPSNGFPAIIEYSLDNGKSWNELLNPGHARNIIDPIGNKRSGFYWYKNIDQKKTFKLQISFGFDQGINYLVYPVDMKIYNNNLLLQINYFSIMKSYKDIYLIPLNARK